MHVRCPVCLFPQGVQDLASQSVQDAGFPEVMAQVAEGIPVLATCIVLAREVCEAV